MRNSEARAFNLPELLPWSASNALALTPAQMEQLACYLDTLVLWGRAIDLVSQSDPDVIVVKHFADSLVPARFCPQDARIADLGSGAGFPGLVLAIALPGATVRVVESRAKRASFLGEVVRLARIDNAEVVHGRAESLASEADHRQAYDVVIARALGSLRDLVRLARPLLQPGALALAMKGPRYAQEIDGQGQPPELIYPYRLPDGSERFLLGLRCT